jgi:hypothetical protein
MGNLMNWKAILFIAIVAVVANMAYNKWKAKQPATTAVVPPATEEAGRRY